MSEFKKWLQEIRREVTRKAGVDAPLPALDYSLWWVQALTPGQAADRVLEWGRKRAIRQAGSTTGGCHPATG